MKIFWERRKTVQERGLLERLKARLGLCGRKRWHFSRTFRTWNGSQYCGSCWRSEMQDLSKSRAWRIEHTGDVGRDERNEVASALDAIATATRAAGFTIKDGILRMNDDENGHPYYIAPWKRRRA